MIRQKVRVMRVNQIRERICWAPPLAVPLHSRSFVTADGVGLQLRRRADWQDKVTIRNNIGERWP